jgi:lysophospholipid acyltransferase (LPLAT)-like uncharacterized protein
MKPLSESVFTPVARIAVTVLASTLSLILRLLYATWRIDPRDLEQLDKVLAHAGRVLVTFWHGQYVPLLPMMRGRQVCIFASRSFRGRVVAAICEQFGNRCVLVPQRGHNEALQIMKTVMRTAPLCATPADGPHGPDHRFKAGLVELASNLQFAIVPLRVMATSSYIAKLRWDRREIPRPFARIHLHVGEPIALPPDLGPKDAKKWSRRLSEEEGSLGAARDIG